MKRWVFSIIAGLAETVLLGEANNLAFRAGYDRLGNVLQKIALWSWPLFGAFFDAVAPVEHSMLSPHPWGGYAALLFDVVVFSIISYAVFRFLSSYLKN